jgi:hypothetical protein
VTLATPRCGLMRSISTKRPDAVDIDKEAGVSPKRKESELGGLSDSLSSLAFATTAKTLKRTSVDRPRVRWVSGLGPPGCFVLLRGSLRAPGASSPCGGPRAAAVFPGFP